MLKKDLCKAQQVSNWELRPLHRAQLHYAALDAYCLVLLADKLEQKAVKRGKGITLRTEMRELLDGHIVAIEQNLFDKKNSKQRKKEKWLAKIAQFAAVA